MKRVICKNTENWLGLYGLNFNVSKRNDTKKGSNASAIDQALSTINSVDITILNSENIAVTYTFSAIHPLSNVFSIKQSRTVYHNIEELSTITYRVVKQSDTSQIIEFMKSNNNGELFLITVLYNKNGDCLLSAEYLC